MTYTRGGSALNIAWLRRGGAPLANALWGALLAQGAPGGLWVLDAVRCARSGESLAARLVAEAPAYAYVSVSTTLAFATFGWLLGRKAEHLRELARTDPLTGLLNRRAFEERLEEELARSERYGLPLSVLLVDVDGLKALNDQQGHRRGDAALRHVASALRSGSRQTDITARWGGDEFVVLAPATTRPEGVELAERIRVASSLMSSPPVTASIGVATLDPRRRVEAVGALMIEADRALYEAKRLGRNRVVAV